MLITSGPGGVRTAVLECVIKELDVPAEAPHCVLVKEILSSA